MTKEEKQLSLLLKDLCGRSPYGVIYHRNDGANIELCEVDIKNKTLNYTDDIVARECKPYLRSMSSMTDEEVKEYLVMLGNIDKSGLMYQNVITKVIDWLDKNMFDHRGLIPMGLALEASEGMYNIK